MDPLSTSRQAEKKDGTLKRPLKLLKMLWPALLAFSPMASAHSRISSSRLMPSVQSQLQKPVASTANASAKKQVFSAFSSVKTRQQTVGSAALGDQSAAMDFLQQQGWLTPGEAQAAALSGNQSLLRKEFAEPDWDDVAAQLSNPSPQNYKYATLSCPAIDGAYFQFINNIGFNSGWSEFHCAARNSVGTEISPHHLDGGLPALRGVLTANDIPQQCKTIFATACEAAPTNAAPTVDANGSGGGTSNTTTFTENGSAVRITTNDASLSDDDNITGMTLVLAATPDGTSEIIAYSAALNGGASLASVSLTGSYNSGSRTYTISGSASAATYQNVMRAMVYTNSSDAPNTAARTVTITATDAEGATGQATVTINITAVNDAPTATNLTQSKTATEGGGAVALDDIVVTDVDTGDTVTATFTLSDPSAGTLSTGTFGSATSTFNAGTGIWTVTGSVADVNAALAAVAFTPSADNDQNFTITTRIRDAANTGPADGTITVTVTAVNDAPTLVPGNVPLTGTNEDSTSPSTLVATILASSTVSDVDTGAAFGIAITGASGNGTWQYSTNGAAWTAFGTVSDSSALLLNSTSRIRFVGDGMNGETATFTWRAWDRTSGTSSANGAPSTADTSTNGGSTAFSSNTATASLTVTSVNDTPSDISLSATSINQTDGVNALIGTLSSADVDIGDTFTYTLVAGVGDTHNASFNISGSSLRANDSSALAAGSYSVRIRTTDNNGGAFEKSFSITLVDDIAPTVTISSNKASLKAGETATVTFTLSESSNSFTEGDATTSNGSLTDFAGSGTVYTATFTPAANTEADATINVGAGGFTDAAGNGNTAATPLSITLDTLAPDAPSTPVLSALSDSGVAGDNITSTTTPVFTGTAEAGSTVTLYDTDGTTVLGTTTATGGTWSITSSVLSEGAHSITAKVSDAAGNVSTASDNLTVQIDTSTPSGHSVSFGDMVYNSSEASAASFTFATAEVGAAYSYVITSSGGGTPVTGSGTVTSATETISNINLTGLSDGTLTLSVTLTDTAGNAAAAVTANATLDVALPSGHSVSFGDTVYNSSEASAASFTFAAAEVGATYSYVITSSGGDTPVTGSGTVTSTTETINNINLAGLSDGTLTLSATLTDTAGNTAAAVTANAALDAALPTASIVVTTTALIEGDTSDVTITFSEAVTGFDNTDLTAENATLSSVSSGDGGVTWTATLTAAVGVNDSANVITLANASVQDAAGNTNAGTTASNNYTVNMANSAPILSGIDGGSTYIENGSAVVIDDNVSVSDADFDVLNSANGNYSGASIVIARSGGAVSSDIIGFINGNGISQIGNSLIKNGLLIANVNSSVEGQWTITFTDANSVIPTRADVIAVLRQLTYSSSNEDPAASVNLDLVVSDGAASSPGVAVVTITPVNDAPTLTATASSPAFTEGGAAVSLFSAAAISTVEAGQLITELQLTVSNLVNGIEEIISVDGSNLVLTEGNSITTATNSMTANVSVSGLTATVVLTKSAGITTADAQTLVNGISYRNTSEAVTNSSRVVTLTRVVDNGGTANSGVDTATISVASTVTATVVNDGPVISGSPATSVNQGATYAFVPGASDLDGDSLLFGILNKPTWANFNTATGALTGTPTNADVGTATGIVISVSDGTAFVSLPAFNLTVVNVNDAPTINGTPAASVNEDSPYSFTPTGADVDVGDVLTFSIANKPGWASFNAATGALTGTPTNADVGTATGIVISVSDGTTSVSLPAFNLTVVNVNDAPTITGTPATSVDQDVAYSFTPVATDIDVGDTLTFSITNKPAWASFNPATGALTGVPAYADAGVYSGIVISVSDGTASASLPAFGLTVVQGANPDAPELTAPANITLNATALYTPVTLAQLLSLPGNASQADIDHALAALASDSIDGNNCCTTKPDGLNANNRLLLAPGRHEVRWSTTNKLNLTDEAVQVINVRPLVSFSKAQTAIRNSQVEFRILLNGRAPAYPFEVAYGIDSTSTATSSEHNLVAGVAVFTESNPLEVRIPVTINPGESTDSQLVVNFTDSQLNKGVADKHSISIRGGNVPPVVRLVMSQNGIETTQITAQDGPVTVRAEVTDLNPGDTHSFDWSSTQGLADLDNDPVNNTRVFDPSSLAQGAYQISVNVQDSTAGQSQALLNFRRVASVPVLSADEDSDNDGISDLDEGFNDSDQNGIPDYLDNMPGSNVLPQVGLITDAYLIECDPGVRCGLGLFALKGNSGGVQLLQDELETLADVIPDATFTPVGGIFDFVINDLPTPGQTVRVVIPQQAPIPVNATYRKYQKGEWVSFVQNANNTLHSAAGDPGYCPPPGAADWQPGLTAGHLCVQLGIEDGGPNDDDGVVNSSVSDPGVVSAAVPVVQPVAPVEIKTKGKGGGSLDLWFIALLLGVVLMMKGNRAGLTLVLLATISTKTQANEWLDKTYLQLDLYQVDSSLNRSHVQSNLRDQGFDLDVTRFDDSRTAWSLAVGYEWNELTYSRIGYLDLGNVSLDLRVAGDTDMAALESALEATYPITASGFTLTQGLQMQLHPSLSLSTELGVFIWDADIDVVADRVTLNYNNEMDMMFGLRLDYQIIPQMSLGVSSQAIRFDHQELTLLGISGRYKF